ncbi:hypothetical protein [Streptomyces iakyrus]|uniref:hypothetical protein n=1 Tax=Streptomyces iakyrus TaxID=68219 RepID=UPI0033FE9336
MKAIGLNTYGGPEVLQVVDLPEPRPGTGEVRVRVRAAAIAPIDALMRTGASAAAHEGLEPPFVPGMPPGTAPWTSGRASRSSSVPDRCRAPFPRPSRRYDVDARGPAGRGAARAPSPPRGGPPGSDDLVHVTHAWLATTEDPEALVSGRY